MATKNASVKIAKSEKEKKLDKRKVGQKNDDRPWLFKNGNPGRPKGSKNKSPARIVDKIIEIDGQLELDGKGLLDCAKQNPKWFYEKIFVKILPKPVDISGDIRGEYIITWMD